MLALVLQGCGSQDEPVEIDPVLPDPVDPIIPDPVDPTDPRDTRIISVSGSVSVDGSLIPNSTVSVYSYQNGMQGALIGSANTNFLGSFSTNVSVSANTSGLLYACASSGSYSEYSTALTRTITTSNQLCAMASVGVGDTSLNLNITPISNAHTSLAQGKMAEGMAPNSALNSASTDIQNTFGIPHNTRPSSSIPSNKTALSSSEKLSVLLKGHVLIADEAGSSFGSLEVAKLLATDIKDLSLDGKGDTSQFIKQAQLGINGVAFEGKTYSGDAILQFLEHQNIGIDSVLGSSLKDYFIQVGGSLGLVPSAESALASDVEAPVISFSLADGAEIGETTTLSINATDESIGWVSKVLVNDEVKFEGEGSSVAINIDPSQYQGLQINVEAFSEDVSGNEGSALISLTPIAEEASVVLQSSAVTNARSYQVLIQESVGNISSSSLKINGVAPSYNGSEYSLNLFLNEGDNDIQVTFQSESGFSYSQDFVVTVDLTSPVFTSNGIQGHNVYLKPFSAAEPALSEFTPNSIEGSVYLDSFHISLDGLLPSIENMKTYNWPAIAITLPVGEQVESVSYNYENNDSGNTSSGQLVDLGEGVYLLPLASEYLGGNWYAANNGHIITIRAIDLAGNSYERLYTFTSWSWTPSLTTDTSASTTLSGADQTIDFESTDFTGMDRVVLVINDVEYDSDSTLNPSFTFDVSTWDNGSYYGIVKAYKDGIEEYSQRVDFAVSNTQTTITISSAETINTATHELTGTAVNEDDGVQSVTVGGVDANYQLFDDSFSRTLSGLSEGWYSVAIEAISGTGLSTVATHEFAVDMTAPEHQVTLPYATANYLVPIKTTGKEPVNQNLTLNNSTKLYIDQYHRELDGEEISLTNLQSKGYSFIQFNPVDNGVGPKNDIFSQFNELIVSYRYYQDDVLKNSAVLSSANVEGVNYLLPLVDEYLLVDYASFQGVHKIEIDVSDAPGNTSTETFEFLTHAASPSVESVVQPSDWVGGSNVTFNFTSTDFTGFDEVVIDSQGTEIPSSSVINPAATLDLSSLTNGVNAIDVIAKKNGVAGYSQEVSFKVDNTAPVIGISGTGYVDTADFDFVGTAIDSESGVKSITVEGELADYDELNETFSKSFTGFSDGVHAIDVLGESNSGVTSQTTLNLNVDTKDLIYANDWPYPAQTYYVKFNSGGGTNLQRLSFESFQSLYFCPENVSLHSNSPTVDYLSSNLYPFIRVYVEDRYSNGAETPKAEITAKYSYYKNFSAVFQRQSLSMEVEDGYFTLPITSEYLGDFYSTSTLDDFHEIYLYLNDKAGNETLKVFKFKVYWDPDSLDW